MDKHLWASVLSENPWSLRNNAIPLHSAEDDSGNHRHAQGRLFSVDCSPSTNFSDSSSSSSITHDSTTATLSVTSAESTAVSINKDAMEVLSPESISTGGHGAFSLFNPVFEVVDREGGGGSLSISSDLFTGWPVTDVVDEEASTVVRERVKNTHDPTKQSSNHHRHHTTDGFSKSCSTQVGGSSMCRDGDHSRRQSHVVVGGGDPREEATHAHYAKKTPLPGGTHSDCYPSRKPRCHSSAVDHDQTSSWQCGYFRFAEQDGSPYYSFSVRGSNEVLFARAEGKPPSSNSSHLKGQRRLGSRESCGRTYTFHCRKDTSSDAGHGFSSGGRTWKNRKIGMQHSRASSSADSNDAGHRLIGKMKVIRDEDRPEECMDDAGGYNSYNKETCFVLYDAACCCSDGSSRRYSDVASSLGANGVGEGGNVEAAAADAARQNDMQHHHHHHHHHRHGYDMQEGGAEVAAIVIRSSTSSSSSSSGGGDKGWEAMRRRAAAGGKDGRRQEVGSGRKSSSSRGWGAGFLRGRRQHQQSSSSSTTLGSLLLLHHHQAAGEEEDMEEEEEGRKAATVTVLLPAAAAREHHYHHHHHEEGGNGNGNGSGGGRGAAVAATPLVERWRWGGKCECGNWDLGCGLSVLQSSSPLPPPPHHPRLLFPSLAHASPPLTTHDLLTWISPAHPLTISTLGHRRKKVLVIEIIQAGLFSLSFQPRFTPLQAFATVVAIFHQQIASRS